MAAAVAVAVASGVAPPAVVDSVQSPTDAEALQGHPNSSLYVGDLDPNVHETHLYDLFKQVATVVSIRVCRDQYRRSLGYAYVNFSNPSEAVAAMNLLNYAPINEKPIRIMLSNRDPSVRLSGKGNIFIKNLDASIDNKALFETFSSFGTILSCKVAFDVAGKSKGYGFVQFEKEDAAQAAIDKLNGMLLNDKQVYVGHFIRRQERARGTSTTAPRFTNIYVKNLPKEIMDEELRKAFGKFGAISSAVVMKDQSGNSRCFGFVNFESPGAAASAVEKMNGISLGEDVLYVGRAQKKSERESELKAKFEQERISRYEKSQGTNLYLKNLDDSVNDEKLKEMFSEFGTITSCKVMVNPQGVSKGFGFVAFSTPEEASRAVNEMNGKMIGKKPLYIAVAQRREDRRAHLQAMFSQIRAPGMPSGMPGYVHPAAAAAAAGGGPQQQVYIGGQNGVASQYGPFPPQFMPGVRAAGGHNFIMPYPLQRQPQPAPVFGFRRAPNVPHLHPQHQLLQRNSSPGLRYMGGNGGRGGMEAPPSVGQGLMRPIVPLALDASPVSVDGQQQKGLLPISKLTSALASASPNDRTRMLGEQLYPLVERQERVNAAKVTGMLLEMDQAEILHLLESPEALKSKVVEAMDVLRLSSVDSTAAAVDDQLGFSATE